ncbi:MAG: folylpolyglutamate synthase/dihydrofolate synthase family protein [Bacteroidales bacterium]
MSFNEDYKKVVSGIFTRFPSVQNSGFGKNSYKPGLDSMRRFDEMLGSPSGRLRTIHVAGTNGKGSVCNMIASILSESGLKTGLYTSPHILDFRERMRIDDGPISKARLVPEQFVYDFLTRWDKTFEDLHLSFFEITTAMAFEWFAEEKVDVAVIEVGLGGRLDSTNIIAPDLSIVTSIGLDHCALLGDTRAKIAAEKAGIFKRGVPVVLGQSDDETKPVFDSVYEKVNKGEAPKPLKVYAEENEVSPLYSIVLANMDLRGEYQEKNLKTALAAVSVLKSLPFYSSVTDNSVEEGLEHTSDRMGFRARWELLSHNPDIICDIGHNAAALKFNFAQLKEYLDKRIYDSLIIIYGVMADKNLDDILPLMPLEAVYILTTPSTPRAMDSMTISGKFRLYCERNSLSTPALYVTESLLEAVQTAKKLIASKKRLGLRPLLYIGGSTFVVADALLCLKKSK